MSTRRPTDSKTVRERIGRWVTENERREDVCCSHCGKPVVALPRTLHGSRPQPCKTWDRTEAICEECQAMTENSSGAERIAAERLRQVNVEGWTAEHDDRHTDGVLAVIAAGLAVEGTDAYVKDSLERVVDRDDQWDLLSKHRHNRIRQLVIAGALIAAEIDRVLRQEERR